MTKTAAVGNFTVVQGAETWIREAIMDGNLKPGERINQDAIAEELGVSRMPIREALSKLEQTGFVVIQPHRGAHVAPLSLDHIEEVYLMRASLESLAARLAAERMTDDVVDRLSRILKEAVAAIEEGEPETLFRLNSEFHRTGYAVSGRRLLCKTINDLRDHSDRYRRFHSRLFKRSKEAFHEHEKIFTAWSERDATAAEHWTRTNLENSAHALVGALKEAAP
jgi:DNA-binding GntR family transcriptional regulator